MRILAEPFLCIDDMAGTSRPPLAAAPRQTARADEIRPRAADERRTIAAARSWLPAETIVLVLAAAIALAFVAGWFGCRDRRRVDRDRRRPALSERLPGGGG